MDILINLGFFVLGAIVSIVLIAVVSASGYDDAVCNAYEKGLEDGRRSARNGRDSEKQGD